MEKGIRTLYMLRSRSRNHRSNWIRPELPAADIRKFAPSTVLALATSQLWKRSDMAAYTIQLWQKRISTPALQRLALFLASSFGNFSYFTPVYRMFEKKERSQTGASSTGICSNYNKKTDLLH